jgi:hypothetical protein
MLDPLPSPGVLASEVAEEGVLSKDEEVSEDSELAEDVEVAEESVA